MRDGQNTEALGIFERRGEDLDLRFERIYPRPPETVWSALTGPKRLRDWMGASRVEPRVGGRIDLMIGAADDRVDPYLGSAEDLRVQLEQRRHAEFSRALRTGP